MAWFKCGGGGIPAALKSLMNAVLNKKWGTSGTYPPETWPETVNLMGVLEEKTVSGSVVTFADGADAVKLKSCAVTIAPTLDGVSSVDVVHGGKNLLPPADNDIWEVGNINASGEDTSGNSYRRTKDYIPVKNTDLFNLMMSGVINSGASDRFRIFRYDKNKNFVSYENYGSQTYPRYNVIGISYIRIRYEYETVTLSNSAMIEYRAVGETEPTNYEPYVTPTTHTANLGRTINGGEVDVVNGTGTDVYTFDLWDGTQNYNVSDALTNVFRFYLAHEKPLPDVTAVQCICDGYTFPRAGWSSDTVSFYSDANNFTLKLPKSEVTTIEQAKAWLAQHNVTFLYATTPETFTFTPVPIISRLGDNTMWGDGDLSVVYRSSGTQTLIPPTLISKTITANGTYSAEDDNADGYDEVTVNVSGSAQNIETVLSINPLIEVSGVSGTDVSRTMWTYTATASGKIVFHANTQVKTNTGANDGYFTVKKNDTVIATTYANTSTTTSLVVPDIDFVSGDVVTVECGFDNYHTSAWFDLYSTITILSSGSAPVLGLGLGNPGPVNEPEQEEPDAAPEEQEEIQEETPEEVDQNESDE